jgi:hypothetical protein
LPDASQRCTARGRLAGILFLAATGVFSLRQLASFDVFWYLRSGEEILRRHALSPVDPFSYTSAQAWTNHEWLAEIFVALVGRLGGIPGLVVFEAAGIVFALAILVRGHWPSPDLKSWPAWVGLACAAVVLGLSAEPRGQLLSGILFAATLALCQSDRARPSRRLYFALPMGVLWANIHGGNPTGVALLAILFVASPSRRRALIAVGAGLATLASPYGLHVHEHFLGAHASLPEIREWHSLAKALALGSIPQWAALFSGLLASTLLVSRFRRREPIVFNMLALLIFGAVAICYARFAWELSLVCASILLHLPATSPAANVRLPARRLLGILIAFAILGLATITARQPMGLSFDSRRVPVAAVEYLQRTQPVGPMLNSYNFGGYLMWAYPREKVFIDSRAFTVYSEAHFQDLLRLYAEPPFFRSLEQRWHFRLAVLQRSGRGARLLAWLRGQPDWGVLHEDDVAVILGKV